MYVVIGDILGVNSTFVCAMDECSTSALDCMPAGVIQPSLLQDGQVCVDMGPPILEGPKVPTTLEPTQVSLCFNPSGHSCCRQSSGVNS